MKIAFLVLATSMFLTGCATQRITCWNEATGRINYIGGYDNETTSNYIVDVADGVRDFYNKKNCQVMTDV
jgi:hypothetical protein